MGFEADRAAGRGDDGRPAARPLRMNAGAVDHGLPVFEVGTSIPKIIHQTYDRLADVPADILEVMARTRAANPDCEHRFYEERDRVAFISEVYGQDVLRSYLRIDPRYGVARCDLFRYLVIYRFGGIYLDLKSEIEGPIFERLRPDDRHILSHWRNGPGERYEAYGIHDELAGIEGGEFQSWYIVAAPGSPLLRATIDAVLTNIDAYRPWRDGVGRGGTLRVTGPIAYTLAILPLLATHAHRFVGTNEDLGVRFNALAGSHEGRLGRHYSLNTHPVVTMHGVARLLGRAVSAYETLKDVVLRREK